MTIRAFIVVMICIASLAASVAAAPPAVPASKRTTAADSTARKRSVAKAAATASAAKGIRTIDAINIEGEIAVPQVLFITSRDNRRYRDGLGKQFRMGTLDVARSFVTPDRLCVAGKLGSESTKEE
jgi:hypothetical protein